MTVIITHDCAMSMTIDEVKSMLAGEPSAMVIEAFETMMLLAERKMDGEAVCLLTVARDEPQDEDDEDEDEEDEEDTDDDSDDEDDEDDSDEDEDKEKH